MMMTIKALLIVLLVTAWLIPAGSLAGEPEYRLLAEKQIGERHTLRIMRGPDISASQLAGIPFLAEHSDRVSAFFQLRFDVVIRNAGEVVILSTLWPNGNVPTKETPAQYSGFEVLALDADKNGVIAVVAWHSSVRGIVVDPTGNYSVAMFQLYGDNIRLSVDAAPGLGKASLSKSPDDRWIVTTSVGKMGYTYEQSEDRRSFKAISMRWEGRERDLK